MSRDKYLYATGLLRTMENKMLDANDMERMLDAPDAVQAFKVFNDTDYADNLLDVEVKDFNVALEDDFKQVKNLFWQIVPDEKLLKIIFYRYDFHNIKLCFKEKYLGKNLAEYASPLGFSEYQKIRKTIIDGQKEDLPAEIQGAIDYIIERASQENVLPHLIDRWADRQYFQAIYGLAQRINNKFIKDLVALQIDIANLKIFIRGKRMRRDSQYIVSEISIHGNILLKEFAGLIEKPLEEGLNYLKRYFSKDASLFIEDYLNHKNLWELERDLENLEFNFIRQSKLIAYGPEVALGYYYAKKNATRNVRLIMTGKLNHIPAEELKERKRELF